MRKLLSTLAVAAVVTTGCYHATVVTGLPASSETVSQQWAAAWIDGLVPPSTVESASKCRNGVAKVETQMSFTNMLVGMITFGIFTPMQIDVTCASSNRMGALPGNAKTVAVKNDASRQELEGALAQAIELSRKSDQPVYLVHE